MEQNNHTLLDSEMYAEHIMPENENSPISTHKSLIIKIITGFFVFSVLVVLIFFFITNNKSKDTDNSVSLDINITPKVSKTLTKSTPTPIEKPKKRLSPSPSSMAEPTVKTATLPPTSSPTPTTVPATPTSTHTPTATQTPTYTPTITPTPTPIDTQPPTTNISYPEDNGQITYMTDGKVCAFMSAPTDNYSLPADITTHFAFDSDLQTSINKSGYLCKVTLKNGSHVLRYRSQDKAGNMEVERMIRFTVNIPGND